MAKIEGTRGWKVTIVGLFPPGTTGSDIEIAGQVMASLSMGFNTMGMVKAADCAIVDNVAEQLKGFVPQ